MEVVPLMYVYMMMVLCLLLIQGVRKTVFHVDILILILGNVLIKEQT